MPPRIPSQQYRTLRCGICLEPCSGGGSQLIDAQVPYRRCFAMELAPRYVDVIPSRW